MSWRIAPFYASAQDQHALEEAVALFLELLEDDPGPEQVAEFFGDYVNSSPAFQEELNAQTDIALVLHRMEHMT